MFNIRQAAVSVLLLILAAVAAHAQCPPRLNDDDSSIMTLPDLFFAQGDEQLLPESGFLSNRSYTNTFFGLQLDLPIEAAGHLIMLPLMPAGHHALLALAFESGNREGSFIITAAEPTSRKHETTDIQHRKPLQPWGPHKESSGDDQADWLMRPGHFSYGEKKNGEKISAVYAATLKNYLVRVAIVSNDKEFLKNAKHVMDKVHLYCALDDGSLTTDKGEAVVPEGTPYEGPTIPTAHVDAKLAEKPEEHMIPAGEVKDGTYRNPELGLQYVLPAGWTIQDAAGDDQSAAPDPNQQRTWDYLRACSRTLLHVKKDTSGGEGEGNSDPQIVLRALDPGCLSLRGPDTARDRQGADELAAYLEMLSGFGEIRSTDLASADNHVFAVYTGTIAERGSGQELASRSSETILATRYNKMLFLWSLIVPKGAALTDMPETNVVFGDNQSVELGPSLIAKH